MKKNILSAVAVILALASLAVSAFTFLSARKMIQEYDAQLEEINGKYLHLQSQVDYLSGLAAEPTETPVETEQPSVEAHEHYCNLIVGDWSFEDAALTVDTAFAQVMAGPGVTVDTAREILTVNGEELYATALTLHPGEASDSYELDLDKARYLLPELSEGDHVELLLEVTLSDGCVLTSCGAGWDYEGGQLLMIAG